MIEKFDLACDSVAFAQLGMVILQSGKALRFRARGASMQPLIREGDQLQVEPLNGKKIHVGNVLLFTVDSRRAVLHRVTRTAQQPDGRLYLLHGDQADLADGWIHETNIMGRLVSLAREGTIISSNQLPMRILGVLAAWRSRLGLKNTRLSRGLSTLLKHLPPFSHYLA